jgi:hypothetical protein
MNKRDVSLVFSGAGIVCGAIFIISNNPAISANAIGTTTVQAAYSTILGVFMLCISAAIMAVNSAGLEHKVDKEHISMHEVEASSAQQNPQRESSWVKSSPTQKNAEESSFIKATLIPVERYDKIQSKYEKLILKGKLKKLQKKVEKEGIKVDSKLEPEVKKAYEQVMENKKYSQLKAGIQATNVPVDKKAVLSKYEQMLNKSMESFNQYKKYPEDLTTLSGAEMPSPFLKEFALGIGSIMDLNDATGVPVQKQHRKIIAQAIDFLKKSEDMVDYSPVNTDNMRKYGLLREPATEERETRARKRA